MHLSGLKKVKLAVQTRIMLETPLNFIHKQLWKVDQKKLVLIGNASPLVLL